MRSHLRRMTPFSSGAVRHEYCSGRKEEKKVNTREGCVRYFDKMDGKRNFTGTKTMEKK